MKSGLRLITIALLLMAFAILAFPQQPAPGLVNVNRVQVRNDHVQEFLELNKQLADSARKAAPADGFMLIYRTVLGNANEFWRFSSMNKFADRDGQPPFFKFTTPEQRTALSTRNSQYVEHSRNMIMRLIPDLMVQSSGAKGPAPFLQCLVSRAKPGMEEQFINILKTDIVPAMKKMNSSMVVVRTELGGSTNDLMGFIGFEKWAELDDEASFIKAMGGEQAVRKWTEKMAQVDLGTEELVLRYLPDLSYFPPQPPAPAKK